MAEKPPDDFVPRPAEFDQLLALLLESEGSTPVAITAALRGAGGFGKTTLAQALCWDARVTRQFSDAILWITLGEKPGDFTGKVLDLVEKGTGERPGFTELRPALDALKDIAPVSQILFGSDYFYRTATETVDALRHCGVFNAQELEQVGSGNAAMVLPRRR